MFKNNLINIRREIFQILLFLFSDVFSFCCEFFGLALRISDTLFVILICLLII